MLIAALAQLSTLGFNSQQIQVQIAERDDIRQQIFERICWTILLTIASTFLPLLGRFDFCVDSLPAFVPLQQLTQSISSQSIMPRAYKMIHPQQTLLEIKLHGGCFKPPTPSNRQLTERERRLPPMPPTNCVTGLAAIRPYVGIVQGVIRPKRQKRHWIFSMAWIAVLG